MNDRIAVFSEKGGTGKTVLTVNLAAVFAGAGKRVLVIDTDSQGNASDLLLDLGARDTEIGDDLSAVLLGEVGVECAIVETSIPGVSIIPAGNRLADAQVELVNAPGRDQRLRNALAEVREQFDTVLIDCPPGRGLLAIAALAASDRVLLPMDPSRGGLAGVQRAIDLVTQVRRHCADPLRPGAPAIAGVVLNRFSQNKTHRECQEQLAETYGDLFLATIPSAVCVDSAGWAARAVVLADPASQPAKAIRQLAERMMGYGTAAAA